MTVAIEEIATVTEIATGIGIGTATVTEIGMTTDVVAVADAFAPGQKKKKANRRNAGWLSF
jgi:hypothetical protein